MLDMRAVVPSQLRARSCGRRLATSSPSVACSEIVQRAFSIARWHRNMDSKVIYRLGTSLTCWTAPRMAESSLALAVVIFLARATMLHLRYLPRHANALYDLLLSGHPLAVQPGAACGGGVVCGATGGGRHRARFRGRPRRLLDGGGDELRDLRAGRRAGPRQARLACPRPVVGGQGESRRVRGGVAAAGRGGYRDVEASDLSAADEVYRAALTLALAFSPDDTHDKTSWHGRDGASR
ncbi:hypothetical protein TPAR_00850 [Tolypocladium paradoxum]|uniref:Uncharacterized protein n=1 Tax=Tolypocladium paradoxum TaxID=94208 RepID=A0A2S4L979_9HYPO|nr:hypothetical protein TPAR_00850 [Tolypocladium paradoxum]